MNATELARVKRKVREFEKAAFVYARIDVRVLTQEDVARCTKVKKELYKLLDSLGK